MSASAIHSISALRKHSTSLHPGGRRNSSSSISSRHSLSEDELENIASHGGPSINHIQHSSRPTIVINHQSTFTPQVIERMRRKLRFFFMNPIEKWQARRRFPWKLLVQVFKIVVITLQISLFGSTRYSHTTFYNDNTISLSHLFLLKWESTRDVKAYPPAAGPFAVYTKNDFYASVDFAVSRYATLRDSALGSYSYAHKNGTVAVMDFCKTFFKEGQIFGFNESYSFDNTILKDCLSIFPTTPINHTTWDNFSSREYFSANNFSIQFDRLIKGELTFALKTVLFKSSLEAPDCYVFNVTIVYLNQNRGGKIDVALDMAPKFLRCKGKTKASLNDSNMVAVAFLGLLNAVVIAVSLLSLVLCCRAIYRAQVLKSKTATFFKEHFGTSLSVNDRLEFLNLWYVLIIINDIVVIIGSVIKMEIEAKQTEDDLYNICSLMLGVGTLLSWFGVLRYLGFYPKYNILILTLRRAAPDVLRFLLCALLIYCGFVFNGWLILGPYHIKFQTLSSTSECLFSLINGDDMFASFAITLDKNNLIWWYSRIYFYSFISLFIYVVISLFISVIMDSYETIKMYYEHGFPKTPLMEFVAECLEDASSGIFREDDDKKVWRDCLKKLKHCCWCKRPANICSGSSSDEYEPI